MPGPGGPVRRSGSPPGLNRAGPAGPRRARGVQEAARCGRASGPGVSPRVIVCLRHTVHPMISDG
eukprot:747518-Hanusia_phi.AAC.1